MGSENRIVPNVMRISPTPKINMTMPTCSKNPGKNGEARNSSPGGVPTVTPLADQLPTEKRAFI